MGREGTRIHILQRREVNPREVKQCAQGHTAFQSERTKPRDCSYKPPALVIAGSQAWMAALRSPSETHCKRSKEWSSPPDIFGLLSSLIFVSAPQFLLWSYIYQASDLFFLPSAWFLQKPEDGKVTWVHLPLICFKWHPIYKIHFPSFDVQLTN